MIPIVDLSGGTASCLTDDMLSQAGLPTGVASAFGIQCNAATAARCQAAVCKMTNNLQSLDCLHSASDDQPVSNADLLAAAQQAMGAMSDSGANGAGRRLQDDSNRGGGSGGGRCGREQ